MKSGSGETKCFAPGTRSSASPENASQNPDRALTGSMRVSRRAGKQQAPAATRRTVRTTHARTAGSTELTPWIRFARIRPSATDAAIPGTAPTATRAIPCPSTIFRTSAASAPRAIRIPIPLVRWEIDYLSTLYMPTTERTRALQATIPSSEELRACATITWHFGASAGREDARRSRLAIGSGSLQRHPFSLCAHVGWTIMIADFWSH
jgi:hypothetical protein